MRELLAANALPSSKLKSFLCDCSLGRGSREIDAARFATNDFLYFFIRQLFPMGEQGEDNKVFMNAHDRLDSYLILYRYKVLP